MRVTVKVVSDDPNYEEWEKLDPKDFHTIEFKGVEYSKIVLCKDFIHYEECRRRNNVEDQL